MKIKVILLAAALGVAMVANSMAQVYSANAVGYVNLNLPAGLSLIGNPLNGSPDNNIDNIMQLGLGTTGTTVWRYDTAAGGYGESIQFVEGLGWLTAELDPNWKILDPGVGFFVQALVPVSVTFVGEVPQGPLANPVPGNSQFSLLASQVPQEGYLGHDDVLNQGANKVGLEFAADNGDAVYIWKASQVWSESYGFVPGLGWLTVDPDNPPGNFNGPLLGVAEGFGILKLAAGRPWNRDFSVND